MPAATCPNRSDHGSGTRLLPRAPRTRGWMPPGPSCRRRQAHHKTRTENARLRFIVRVARSGLAVFNPDASAMRLDDLLGNRKAQSGILTEVLLRAVRVEPLEDFLQRLRLHARTIVVDDDID